MSRVVFGVEVAVLPAPIRPAAGHPVEDLAGVTLRAELLVASERLEHRIVGDGALQPGRHVGLVNPHRRGGHPRLAAVLLRQNVHRDLAPVGGNHDVLGFEDHRTVGINDPGSARLESHAGVRVSGDRIRARKLHTGAPPLYRTRVRSQWLQACRTGNLLCHIRDVTTRYWGCSPNPCVPAGDLAVDGGGEPALA